MVANFLTHLYTCTGGEKDSSILLQTIEGKMKPATQEAGNLAWFKESGFILWCLTGFPSQSKLVVAELVQLLSCLSNHLPAILSCRPRGSSDDSKEQIVSWRSLHSSFLSEPLAPLWEASSQSWYLFSLIWLEILLCDHHCLLWPSNEACKPEGSWATTSESSEISIVTEIRFHALLREMRSGRMI